MEWAAIAIVVLLFVGLMAKFLSKKWTGANPLVAPRLSAAASETADLKFSAHLGAREVERLSEGLAIAHENIASSLRGARELLDEGSYSRFWQEIRYCEEVVKRCWAEGDELRNEYARWDVARKKLHELAGPNTDVESVPVTWAEVQLLSNPSKLEVEMTRLANEARENPQAGLLLEINGLSQAVRHNTEVSQHEAALESERRNRASRESQQALDDVLWEVQRIRKKLQ